MTADPLIASIHIDAAPEQVFDYFVRSEALVRWMGEHAMLDPKPDGEFSVDIRGVPVRGRYLEIEPPHRLLISWGHAGSERLPPGASLVEVRLQTSANGTTVTVSHSGLPEPEATGHQRGWRLFLSQLATTVTTEANRSPDTASQ